MKAMENQGEPQANQDAPALKDSSRRKFLQGAALATATAAAAAGGAAAIAGVSHKDLAQAIQSFGSQQGIISGATCGGCTTNTVDCSFSSLSQITSGSGEHVFMLWFWINNAQAGTYTGRPDAYCESNLYLYRHHHGWTWEHLSVNRKLGGHPVICWLITDARQIAIIKVVCRTSVGPP
jgi:hypothetical protein